MSQQESLLFIQREERPKTLVRVCSVPRGHEVHGADGVAQLTGALADPASARFLH